MVGSLINRKNDTPYFSWKHFDSDGNAPLVAVHGPGIVDVHFQLQLDFRSCQLFPTAVRKLSAGIDAVLVQSEILETI